MSGCCETSPSRRANVAHVSRRRTPLASGLLYGLYQKRLRRELTRAVQRLLRADAQRGAAREERARSGAAEAVAAIGVAQHHLHQAHVQGLRRTVLAAPEPDLPRLLLPDDAGEVRGAEAGVERAHPRAGLAEAGRVSRDADVAQHMQDMAAADRDAVDRGDHRLGDVPDELVQVTDAEPAALAWAVVTSLRALLDVAAGAERLLAGSGEDHALHLVS